MADFDPIHPGAVLREDFLRPHGITQAALARALDVNRGRIADVVHGRRPVTPDLALRLARYFGMSPEFWLNLQTRYDLEHTRDREGDAIARRVRPRAA